MAPTTCLQKEKLSIIAFDLLIFHDAILERILFKKRSTHCFGQKYVHSCRNKEPLLMNLRQLERHEVLMCNRRSYG